MLRSSPVAAAPAGIRKAGRRKVTAIAATHAPRTGEKLVADIWTALGEQTVTVPGTATADTVLPRLADSLKTVLQQRKQVATEVEDIIDVHPPRDRRASAVKSSAHLDAYAGIASTTRKSRTSINGEHPTRAGNRNLKRAFFLAAFAPLRLHQQGLLPRANAKKARNTTPPSSA